MEVLNLKNDPVLFLPVSAFSDPVVTGKPYHYGANLSILNNDFFRYLYVVDPRDLEEEKRKHVLGVALSCAADHLQDVGIVLVGVDNHLSVVCTRLEDQGYFPVIFNATFATEESDANGHDFYRLYDGADGEILGGGLAIHSPKNNIFWDDIQLEDFSSKAE